VIDIANSWYLESTEGGSLFLRCVALDGEVYLYLPKTKIGAGIWLRDEQ
jgi:hypothetical protein